MTNEKSEPLAPTASDLAEKLNELASHGFNIGEEFAAATSGLADSIENEASTGFPEFVRECRGIVDELEGSATEFAAKMAALVENIRAASSPAEIQKADYLLQVDDTLQWAKDASKERIEPMTDGAEAEFLTTELKLDKAVVAALRGWANDDSRAPLVNPTQIYRTSGGSDFCGECVGESDRRFPEDGIDDLMELRAESFDDGPAVFCSQCGKLPLWAIPVPIAKVLATGKTRKLPRPRSSKAFGIFAPRSRETLQALAVRQYSVARGDGRGLVQATIYKENSNEWWGVLGGALVRGALEVLEQAFALEAIQKAGRPGPFSLSAAKVAEINASK